MLLNSYLLLDAHTHTHTHTLIKFIHQVFSATMQNKKIIVRRLQLCSALIFKLLLLHRKIWKNCWEERRSQNKSLCRFRKFSALIFNYKLATAYYLVIRFAACMCFQSQKSRLSLAAFNMSHHLETKKKTQSSICSLHCTADVQTKLASNSFPNHLGIL